MIKFFKMGGEFFRGSDITWYSYSIDKELGTIVLQFKTRCASEYSYSFEHDMPVPVWLDYIITEEELNKFEEIING